jgi:hypothetical protein
MRTPRMSRAHFVLIAETIRTLPSFELRRIEEKKMPQCEDVVRFEVICSCFADALRSTNPQFDRSRFLEACNGK